MKMYSKINIFFDECAKMGSVWYNKKVRGMYETEIFLIYAQGL